VPFSENLWGDRWGKGKEESGTRSYVHTAHMFGCHACVVKMRKFQRYSPDNHAGPYTTQVGSIEKSCLARMVNIVLPAMAPNILFAILFALFTEIGASHAHGTTCALYLY